MRNIGSYFEVVDADEHRIIEELRNLREKKYISGLAKLVHQYKIPPDLVYGQDETNAQFVSRPNKTRAEKGAKL